MKSVLVMRGLPGSGKSTLATKLASDIPGAVIVSADDFFNGGEIDEKVLGYAHQWCRNNFIKELKKGTQLVIVDNTNSTRFEIQFYMDKAKEHGYEVAIMAVPCDVETSMARNVHKVPRSTIEKMATRLDNFDDDPSWTVYKLDP
jgi:predicted kinase